MGIPGLINAIGAGERISLSRLALTHLERTAKPIRVAVDISIWLFQVQASRGGSNPELRTLFYRLLKLLALPIHPLFVYDGKEKPPFKRGKASGGSYGNLPIIRLSKILIDIFKFPRHDAPGEAEAECARLQTAGVVDAVMSNDVDALMFGSTLTVMNFSKESGSGTTAATHITCYQMGDPEKPSGVMLDRAGMILFAMLSGGDYLPSGVPKCGSKLAAEIARAGFGADLLEALDSEGAQLDLNLNEWRERLQYELEENESGYFQTKHKVVRIPETFPDRRILSFYAKPAVSTESDIDVLRRRLVNAWDQDIDVIELRRFAANVFEWNYRSGARKVTKLLAEPLISYRLRLQKQLSSLPEGAPRISDSGSPMLQKVYRSRTSFSTDGMTELQLDYIPVDVVGLDLLAEEPNPPLPSQDTTVSGDEEENLEAVEPVAESSVKKRVTKRYDPYALEKIWVFETLASIGIPGVVQAWKKEQAEKAEKASAPKKSSTRKTGPRKKGPIDPGMKRGSILKYGTLTKERSEISESKHVQLFEAAVSSMTTSYSSPKTLNSQSFSDIPTETHGYSTDLYTMTSFKDCEPLDLADRFSSSCTISPNTDVKRHPMSRPRMTTRRGLVCSADTEVDVIDVSSPEVLDCAWSPVSPRRIRMSYSNAICKDLSVPDSTAHGEPAFPLARSRPRGRPPKAQSSHEVQELEHAMSSVILEDIPPCKITEDHSEALKIADSTPKRESRKSKAKELKADSDILEKSTACSRDSPEKASPSRIQNILEKSALDMRSLQRQQGKVSNARPCIEDASCPEQKTKAKTSDGARTDENNGSVISHLESIIVDDGYWTVDTDPETELASEESWNQGDNKKSRSKGKRLTRVSMIDLS